MKFSGKVWVFGDNIDTDVMISGKYLRGEDPKQWADHVFEVLGADHAAKIQAGDIVIGGENFGCGSSREQAAIAIKEKGVAAVVAKSFGRIFFRNAINIGLPVIVCPDIKQFNLRDGDEISLDLGKGEVVFGGKKLGIQKLPDFMIKILQAGGLINYYNEFEAKK
jgi:3-isopropylmalate dehydratase small subunit